MFDHYDVVIGSVFFILYIARNSVHTTLGPMHICL